MNGDIQVEGPDNLRNKLIIGGIAAAVVIAIVVGAVVIIRNRGAAEQVPGATNGAAPVGGTNAAPAVNAAPAAAPMTGDEILKKIVAERAAQAQAQTPVPSTDIELNVEKTMTAEEKRRYGFNPSVEVKYKWVIPQSGGGPVMIVTNPPPIQPDADNDGLPDDQEKRLGTDPNNPDTDGDGIYDGDEVNAFHTDPLTPNPLPQKK